MSTIDKIIIQHLKSSDVITDSSSEISQDFDGQKHPKIPDASQLEYGEVALNVAKDYEIIGIKNNDGEFVYLPFNIAKRMLRAEKTLDDLGEFVFVSVDELSASTTHLYNTIDEFGAEISNISDIATTLSGITTSGLTYIQDEIINTSGNVINYVDVKSEALSSYTTNVSGDLYTYITQQDGQIIEKIDNLKLSGLSDVELAENEYEYEYESLDKEGHYENCYIQVPLEDSVLTFCGEWGDGLNELVWDIINCNIGENTPEKYKPNVTIPASAVTENSQLVTLSYVSQNGETITIHEDPSEYVCRDFNILLSTYGNAVPSMSEMESNKISIADAYNQNMRYVYIEEFPDDIEVYFYPTPTSAPNKCTKFEGFDNVWQFNGTLTQNSEISLYSPSLENQVRVDINICESVNSGDAQRGMIHLCYGSIDGGIYSTLTNENPVRVFEVLAKSGDVWTNQIIGVGSKSQYGIVKIGDNINVNDGIISIDVEQEPTSGSTNPISSGFVYGMAMDMETLTNEEMDILLGGPLPTYLMDENGDMILDQEGNLIELI